MNTEYTNECEWLEKHVDAWVCGEAAPEECARVDAHIEVCPACADRAAEARELSGMLAELRGEACPPEVLDRAFAEVDRGGAMAGRAPHLTRYLAAAAVLLATVGAAVFLGYEQSDEPRYSAEEIAQAERELAGVLGYVAQTGAQGFALAFEETLASVAKAGARDENRPPAAAKTARHVRNSLVNRFREIGNVSRDSLGSAREQFMEVDAIALFSGNLRAMRDASATEKNPNQGD